MVMRGVVLMLNVIVFCWSWKGSGSKEARYTRDKLVLRIQLIEIPLPLITTNYDLVCLVMSLLF